MGTARNAGPQFTMQWEGREEGPLYSLQSMVAANTEDEDLCDWLWSAKRNDEYTTGGGAAPACTVRRVL